MHMVVHPPDYPSQDIAPPLVGRDESLRHEECRTSHVVCDDSHVFGIFFALTSEAIAREVAVCLVAQFLNDFDDRCEEIGLIGTEFVLEDFADSLKSHPRIDILIIEFGECA